MEIDTLYLFNYSGPGDKAEYHTKISGDGMLMLEFASDKSLQGNYNLVIEIDKKVYFIGLEYATLAQNLINALRRAKKSKEELSRSNFDKITRNTDGLIEMYRMKVVNNILTIRKERN